MTDSFYLKNEGILTKYAHANIDFYWGPWTSVNNDQDNTSAFTNIPVGKRIKGLKFGVVNATTGDIEEYMFTKDNATDNDIIKLVLSEGDINLPQDIAEVFTVDENTQGYDALNSAVQAEKVIVWHGNIVNIEHYTEGNQSTQYGVYKLSFVDGEGYLHVYTIKESSANNNTVEHIQLTKEDQFFIYNAGTTYQELQSRGQKPVKVDGYIARIVQGDNLYTIKYVDGEGVLHIITHDSSNSKTTTTKDLSESVHIDADNVNKVFAIKDNKGTTIGSITLGTNATNGAAKLTFVAGSDSFVASLPNLAYDSSNQMLKMVKADGTQTNLIKLSNLQIKGVGSTLPCWDTTATPDPVSREANVATGAPHWAIGDLFLLENSSTTPSTFNLCVCTNVVDDGTYYNYSWENIGSINDVSLVADQVGLNSTKLIATDVKTGLEELSDKIENIQATVWSGYVGASNATTIENVNLNLNNLTHYSNKSGSVDVQISSFSYLWFVVNREVRIESFGIEVPVEYMGMDNDLYYYKTYEQILPSTIGVELIATDASQSDDSGGGDTPTAQKPMIVTPPQSANYNEGATPNALTVVASVSDGGTLSFQWYKDNSPFGSADSGTAVSNGVQSSITPTSVTATYYCVITNSKSGANSNTNQTTSVTVTFNEESGSEETDLSDFVEGYWNASGQKVEDSNYLSSPLIDVSTDKNFVVFNDISKTGKTTSPTHVLSLWTGENTCRGAWEDSDKGRADSAASGDTYMRFVFPNDASRADYCFIKIGNNYPFKGSKIKDAFLSKIYAFGKKMSNNSVTKGSDVNIVNNNTITLGSDQFVTFIAGPFNIQSGHTYTFELGRTSNGNSALDKITYVDANDKLVASQYGTNVNSFSPDTYTPAAGATKFYLTCVFKNMHNCYLKDNGVYVWYGANIEI